MQSIAHTEKGFQMSTTTTELRQRVRRTVEKARSIAEMDGFNTDPELQRNFDRAMNDAKRLRDDADEAELGDARSALGSVIFGNSGHEVMTVAGPEVRELMRPIDPAKGLVQHCEIPLNIQKRLEYPILGSDAAHTYGSYAIPTSLDAAVSMSLLSQSGVLEANPRIIRTATGELLNVPILASDITNVGYRAEGAAALQGTPALSELPLHAYSLAGYVTVSQEFLTDAISGGGPAFVGELCGRALGQKLALELAVGDGSDHVDGLFHGATTGKTAAAKTVFTANELLELRASTPAAARKNGRWVFSDAAYNAALLFLDANGQYLIHPDASAAVGGSLWGQEVHIDAFGPALVTTNKVVVYGDIGSAYVVRFSGNLEVTRSDDIGLTEFVSWMSVFRFQVKVDAGFTSATDAKALTLS